MTAGTANFYIKGVSCICISFDSLVKLAS